MSDVRLKRIDEIEYYQGSNAIPGIKFHSAAKALGVTAWGMGLIEMEPNCTGYPEHDHLKDGQEEVYAVIRGSATLKAGGEEFKLEPGTLIRVGPDTKRKIIAGPQGVAVLAI